MQADTTTEFSTWLRSQRKALDLTRQELAFRVGCSPATIEKVEIGERRPSQQIAALLASCLQVPDEAVEEFVRFARGGPMPAARAAAQRISHVPSPPTSFVGRKSQIDAIAVCDDALNM
ncbi:MAG: helix-turn-helix transcriptional regulator [Chloroflexota bacterium]